MLYKLSVFVCCIAENFVFVLYITKTNVLGFIFISLELLHYSKSLLLYCWKFGEVSISLIEVRVFCLSCYWEDGDEWAGLARSGGEERRWAGLGWFGLDVGVDVVYDDKARCFGVLVGLLEMVEV